MSRIVPHVSVMRGQVEGNSDSHLKTAMVGNSVTVLVEGGRLVLGQWQGIYLCEFDGPRRREVLIRTVDLGSHGG